MSTLTCLPHEAALAARNIKSMSSYLGWIQVKQDKWLTCLQAQLAMGEM